MDHPLTTLNLDIRPNLEPVSQLLQSASERLDRGDAAGAFAVLAAGLQRWFSVLSAADFERDVVQSCRRHSLYERFAADPLTRRAREKPRGYAGDAVMLDALYEGMTDEQRARVCEEGQRLFAATARTSRSSAAVRERRRILACALDRIGARRPNARVLSVACGHLREAALSVCVRDGRIAEFVAIDQDPESLREVRAAAYGACVRTVEANIGAILKGRIELGSFDLIYCAGLYDYLEQCTATLLTRHLFEHVVPRGELLIGNFRAGFPEQGFVEAMMEWRLIGRTRGEMRALFDGLPQPALETLHVFADSVGDIAYAHAVRRASG